MEKEDSEDDHARRLKGNLVHDYIAGALGGAAGIIIGFPFDTTKVQMQTQNAKTAYTGTMDAIRNIHKQGWVRGFFRGMSWPLLSYGVVNSVFFGVYGNSVKLMQKAKAKDLTQKPTHGEIFLSGCLGGAAQLFFLCPVEVVKVVLQSQIPHSVGMQGSHRNDVKQLSKYYKGPLECAKDIYRTSGVRAFYTGMMPLFWRDVPSFGLYCWSYEYLSSLMHKHGLTDKQGIISSVVAGGIAGTVTWLVVMPFDVTKSRLQADLSGKYNGMIDCMRKSVQAEGRGVLFRGTLVTCLRAFPVNATTFLVYSQTLHHLHSQ